MFELIPSELFLEQLNDLSPKSKQQLEQKLLLVKENPFRDKRIQGYELFLFRIRFEDKSREKRVIYLVDKPKIKLLCILDRSNDYKDLKSYIKRLGYL